MDCCVIVAGANYRQPCCHVPSEETPLRCSVLHVLEARVMPMGHGWFLIEQTEAELAAALLSHQEHTPKHP